MNYNPPCDSSCEERDYQAISDHGLIGNLRTAAMVSMDGSIESYCVPYFDSPSVFARILDKHKGGHFSITPKETFKSKQNYLPSSNILQTKFMNNNGVIHVTDFLPRYPKADTGKPLLPWLIRRVEAVRGNMSMRMECAPAFDYARAPHTMQITSDEHSSSDSENTVVFESEKLKLDLRYVVETTLPDVSEPRLLYAELDLRKNGHKGLSVYSDFKLSEGQAVTFVLRSPPDNATRRDLPGPTEERAKQLGVSVSKLAASMAKLRPEDDPALTVELVNHLLKRTNEYWNTWIRQSTYKGSWKEAVHRSALALKLLIFEPTGAVVASPTFSLPEYIGGTRNWDYRASWIRDSSFTLYALIRLGYTEEANAYLEFIYKRLKDKNQDGSLQIMFTIHGEKDLEEIELTHLDGHKGSKPVRIGNGAANHLQLDIYGELMDCIYLGQKFGKPLSYENWVLVRELVDYVVANHTRPDLSIWEVRGKELNFTYSKVMMWVAIDRGLRLADKRSLPCPKRMEWIATRDSLYESIMEKSWNPKMEVFGQSYEQNDVLDSAILIMPLVFFIAPSDPRFVKTLKHILRSPDRGGLTSNNLVYRYDTEKADDGVGGQEGSFSLCTLWCVEALARAGQYEKPLAARAISMFEDFLLYLNHVGLCTEEISESGEGLGNFTQGFTHVTLISAAYNLSRGLV